MSTTTTIGSQTLTDPLRLNGAGNATAIATATAGEGGRATATATANAGTQTGAASTNRRDAAGQTFIDAAMQFGRNSRSTSEQDFFRPFRPIGGGNTDIRISIDLQPALPPYRPAPPPPPMWPQPQPQPISNPTNADTRMQDGKAVFENDNYTITSDDNSSVVITNKKTGSVYEAWGDPHFKVNGEHQFDFYGTTSFDLDDGTKVTIGTVDNKNGDGTTLSSKVTITSGDYGVQMKGVDGFTTGDLAFQEFEGKGRQLDARVADGVLLNENAAGNDMVTTDQNGVEFDVDQAYINGVDEQLTMGKKSDNVSEFDELAPDWREMMFGNSNGAGMNAWAYGGASAGFGGFGGFGGSGGFGGFGGFDTGSSSNSFGDGSAWASAFADDADSAGGSGAGQLPWWSNPSFFDRSFGNSAASARQPSFGLDLGIRTDGFNTQLALAMRMARNASADINLRVWG